MWRNEAMEEARLWRARSSRVLPPRETAFLEAVFALANRTTRVKRRVVYGAFTFLCILVAAAAIALIMIRNAEHSASEQAHAAKLALDQSQRDAEVARVASEQAAKSATEREEALRENLEQATQMMALKATAQKANTKADVAVHKADTATRLATKHKEDADRAKAALEAEKQRKAAEEKKRSGSISTGGLSK